MEASFDAHRAVEESLEEADTQAAELRTKIRQGTSRQYAEAATGIRDALQKSLEQTTVSSQDLDRAIVELEDLRDRIETTQGELRGSEDTKEARRALAENSETLVKIGHAMRAAKMEPRNRALAELKYGEGVRSYEEDVIADAGTFADQIKDTFGLSPEDYAKGEGSLWGRIRLNLNTQLSHLVGEKSIYDLWKETKDDVEPSRQLHEKRTRANKATAEKAATEAAETEFFSKERTKAARNRLGEGIEADKTFESDFRTDLLKANDLIPAAKLWEDFVANMRERQAETSLTDKQIADAAQEIVLNMAFLKKATMEKDKTRAALYASKTEDLMEQYLPQETTSIEELSEQATKTETVEPESKPRSNRRPVKKTRGAARLVASRNTRTKKAA